jgi:uncharacterized protein with HEPN domain
MLPETLKYLFDVRQACRLVAQFTHAKTAADFRNDLLLQSAVERQFITIGEALQQALRIQPELANSISESRRIVNFRNVIVHGYAVVVPDTVWGVVESDLPKLQEEVAKLLVDVVEEPN